MEEEVQVSPTWFFTATKKAGRRENTGDSSAGPGIFETCVMMEILHSQLQPLQGFIKNYQERGTTECKCIQFTMMCLLHLGQIFYLTIES